MRRNFFEDYRLFRIKLIFYDPSRMLQLSEFVWTLRSSVLVVFNNFLLTEEQIEIKLVARTDRNKISSYHHQTFFDVSLSLPPFIFREHSL